MIAKEAWNLSVEGVLREIKNRATTGHFDCFIGVWERGLPERLINALFEKGYDVREESNKFFYADWKYANEKS